MLKKNDFLRLIGIAAALVVALIFIVVVLPKPARTVIVPTFAQLPSQTSVQAAAVAALPTDLPPASVPDAETSLIPASSAAVAASATPLVVVAVPSATLEPPTSALQATSLSPSLPPSLTAVPTDAALEGLIPTALAFPTLPQIPAPTYTFVPAALPPAQETIPNQLIIAFQPNASQSERDAYVASLGGVVTESGSAPDTVVVQFPADAILPQSFAASSVVASVSRIVPTVIPLDESRLSAAQQALIAQANQSGTVDVIVGLNIQFRTLDQTSTQAFAAQQVSVQALRQQVVAGLAAFKPQVLSDSAIWTIPYVALRVNVNALRALLASPSVANVTANGRSSITLDSAEPVIHAPQVWAMGYTGVGRYVAVLDTGVDRTHPFLGGRVVNEACFSGGGSTTYSNCPGGGTSQTGTGSASPSSCFAKTANEGCAHGTHVSGIAAGFSSTSFSGVAPSASIIGVDVFSTYTDNVRITAYDSDVLSGLNYIYNLHSSIPTIDAVNLSLGDSGRGSSSYCDAVQPATTSAFQLLRSAGVAPVVATGNDSTPSFVSFPGCISYAVSVGASTDADGVASFSNTSGSIQKMFAPGASINSSVPVGSVADVNGTGYASWNGTSMATPFITGAFAVYRQFAPGASVDTIVNTFRNTGRPITVSDGSVPRLNLEAAITGIIPPTPTLPPTPVPPPNDLIGNATVINGLPYTHSQSDILSATITAGDPAYCRTVSQSVWYRYTPPTSTTLTVSTVGSSYDTVLAVFDGSSLAQLSCDDDSGGNYTSLLSLAVTGGQSYLIGAAAYGSGETTSVTLVLNVSSTAPTSTPTNTPSNTPSSTPSRTPSNTPTRTPTNTPTRTPSYTPSSTSSKTPSNTPSSTYTSTPSRTPSNTPTRTPSYTPSRTNTYTPTRTPSNTPTRTNTYTPTYTPTPSDAIFSDGFESGNLSAWTASTTDGGNLSVSPAAALVGNYGLQAVINDLNPLYLTDDTPNAEPRYRARFDFDPNSLVMAENDGFVLLYGYQGASTLVLQLQVRFSGGNYQIRVSTPNDAGTWVAGSFVTLSDAPHLIELDWQAASAAGANNGSLTLWVDEVAQPALAGIDNDTRRVDRVRLGAVGGLRAGTHGTFFLDGFISRRQTYIGHLLAAPTLRSPVDAAVLARESGPSFSWNTVAGASQYYAELTNGTTVSLNSGWIGGTSWAPGVQPGGSYSWRVKARLSGSGEDSVWSSVRTLRIRPGIVTNLQATSVTSSRVSLSWTASLDAPGGIDGYHVYRDGAFKGTAASSATAFSETTVASCTTYHYTVRAYKGTLESTDSNSVTATTSCDAIFSDDFESGNLSAWTASTTDGGNLSVTTAAKLVGSYGLQAVVNDLNPLYLTDDTPNAEPRYRARFDFDPNTLTMAENDGFVLLYGYQGTSTLVLQLQVRFSGGNYQIRISTPNDAGTWVAGSFVTLSDAPHLVELDWQAASGAGANNGSLTLWVDEVAQPALTGIDNDTRRIDRVRLGAVGGLRAGTQGTFFLDDFVSRRQTYIGPSGGALSLLGSPSLNGAATSTEAPTQLLATEAPSATLVLVTTEEVTPETTAPVDATTLPTASATLTLAAASTPTVTAPATLPTAAPFPTLDLTSVVQPTALPFPTLDLTALPPVTTPVQPALPISDDLENGAADWAPSAGWTLQSTAANGGTGMAWQVTAANTMETLNWLRPIDLRGLASGQQVLLSFQSLLVSAQSGAVVQVSGDGQNWMTLTAIPPFSGWTTVTTDLTPYVGQVVQVRFIWQGIVIAGSGAADNWWIDSLLVAAVAGAPTAAPTLPPTAAATSDVQPTEVAPSTLEVTSVPPTSVPTLEPTATLVPTTIPPTQPPTAVSEPPRVDLPTNEPLKPSATEPVAAPQTSWSAWKITAF